MFDVTNFDKMFTSDEAVHSVVNKTAAIKIDKNKHKFNDFDK